MAVERINTSIKEANEKKAEQENLKKANELLQEQVTDLQIALCDVYELLIEATMGGNA